MVIWELPIGLGTTGATAGRCQGTGTGTAAAAATATATAAAAATATAKPVAQLAQLTECVVLPCTLTCIGVGTQSS